MAWTVEILNEAVAAELLALPDDMQARFQWIAHLIKARDLEQVHQPYIDHLGGPIWEIRMKGRDGIARALYVTAKGQRVVVVRVFVKKTQRTPSAEIRLAKKEQEKSHDEAYSGP
jgi:phage-related protein